MINHHLFDIVAGIVLACSIVSAVLPPYEVFSFSPTFQSIYRIILVFVTTIGSLNLRGLTMKFYPSYQAGGNLASTNPSPQPTVPPAASSTH